MSDPKSAPRVVRPPPSAQQRGRRRFLRLGLAGTAALAAGAVLAWQTSGYEVPDATARTLIALSAKEYLVVAAVAARILRSDGADFPSADDVDAALFIDKMVARVDPANRTDLLRLLHLLEHVIPLQSGRAGRFTRLDGAGQDAVLTAMMTSPVGLVRGAFEALKSLCVMAYFRDPRTWGAIGYDGPLVGRPREGWTDLATLGARRERAR